MTFLLGKEKGAIGLGSPGSPSYPYCLSKIIHSAPLPILERVLVWMIDYIATLYDYIATLHQGFCLFVC